MITRLRSWRTADGRVGERLYLWCPGCDDLHAVEVKDNAVKWEWDGNRDAPTISPSILVNGREPKHGIRCHSYVKAGVWEFLSDCDHEMAGQHVPCVPLPDWVTREDES